MGKCTLIILSLLLQSGTLALSQTHFANEPAASSPWDVYAGGAYIGSNPASSASAGFGGGIDFFANHWIGGRGDVSVFRATSGVANTTTTVDYLVGPRIGRPSGSRLSPFADFLVGVQTFHNGSTQHTYYYGNGSGFALAADGGLDMGLTKHFAFRGQAGFSSSRYATAPTTTTNNRWRAGTFLVYRF